MESSFWNIILIIISYKEQDCKPFWEIYEKINRALDIRARMCYNINVEAETACRKVWSLLMKHTLHLSESSVAADGSLFHFGFYVYQYREHKAQNTADRSNI